MWDVGKNVLESHACFCRDQIQSGMTAGLEQISWKAPGTLGRQHLLPEDLALAVLSLEGRSNCHWAATWNTSPDACACSQSIPGQPAQHSIISRLWGKSDQLSNQFAITVETTENIVRGFWSLRKQACCHNYSEVVSRDHSCKVAWNASQGAA